MIGQTVSHYKIVAKFGGGRKCDVYTGEDAKFSWSVMNWPQSGWRDQADCKV